MAGRIISELISNRDIVDKDYIDKTDYLVVNGPDYIIDSGS